MSDLGELILKHYPKAIDCVPKHLGQPIEVPERELDDDRYYDIIVTRCGHCNMPLGSRYV